MFAFFIVIFISIFFQFSLYADEKNDSYPWKIETKEERFEVYSRVVPGTDIKEVKASALMTGTVKEAVDVVFHDRNHHFRIFKNVKVSKILSKTQDCDISYNLVSFPLISDRDYIIQTCVKEKNDISAEVVWEDIAYEEKAPGKNTIRVIETKGYWKIHKIGPDEIKLDCYIFVDAGGSIPSFIQNMANKKAVPDMLFSVYREIIRRRNRIVSEQTQN